MLVDLAQLSVEVAGADAHRDQLSAVAGDFFFQIARAAPFVLDGRLARGDTLAILRDALVAGPSGRFGLGDLHLQAQGLGFQRLRLGSATGVFVARGR